MLRTGEIDISTRIVLACELSCIAYKHGEICFFLLSLHRLVLVRVLLFLLAFLCVMGWCMHINI